MSSIEQQLVRDIAAVTEGVVVTDSDLREARNKVDELIVTRHRRDRRRTVAAVAAAVVLVAGGVTAFLTLGDDDGAVRPAGPPKVVDPDADWLTGAAPTTQLVQGVWRLDNGDSIVQFEPNGQVRFTVRGSLFTNPDGTGTYSIHGDVIDMTTSGPGQDVCADARFSMRVSLADTGIMHFVRSGPPDSGCSPLPFSFSRGRWEQLLPTGPDLAGAGFSKDSQWKPLTDKYNLYGDLMPEGGGYVIEVNDRGTYSVADESGAVVDQGQSTLRHATLTLTSGADSQCAQGDRLVLTGMEYESPGINGVRGTVQRDDCNGGWAARTWITIAHLSTD